MPWQGEESLSPDSRGLTDSVAIPGVSRPGTRSFSLGCNRSCLKVSSQEFGGSEVTAT